MVMRGTDAVHPAAKGESVKAGNVARGQGAAFAARFLST